MRTPSPQLVHRPEIITHPTRPVSTPPVISHQLNHCARESPVKQSPGKASSHNKKGESIHHTQQTVSSKGNTVAMQIFVQLRNYYLKAYMRCSKFQRTIWVLRFYKAYIQRMTKYCWNKRQTDSNSEIQGPYVPLPGIITYQACYYRSPSGVSLP